MYYCPICFVFFFFNDTATTEIYTLSLHDALPISRIGRGSKVPHLSYVGDATVGEGVNIGAGTITRSEEHTSELQSRLHLVCRLLLEKKKTLRSVIRAMSDSRMMLSILTERSRRYD